MSEPRQINPVQLNIGTDTPDRMDFTPRPVPVPKDSSVPAFADNSPNEQSKPPVQSAPQSSSEGSITTLPSSLLSDTNPSSESAAPPETSASAEKAPTPKETVQNPETGELIIEASENPVPLPKSNIVAPPPVS